MKFVKKLSDIIQYITKYLLFILGIVLIAIVFYGVVKRYVFDAPVAWGFELATLIFIWISFLGSGYALKNNQHIKFDFVIDMLPQKIRRVIDTFVNLIIFVFFLYGSYWGYDIFLSNIHKPFKTLPITYGWFYLALPVSFLVMAVHALSYFLEEIKIMKSNQEL